MTHIDVLITRADTPRTHHFLETLEALNLKIAHDPMFYYAPPQKTVLNDIKSTQAFIATSAHAFDYLDFKPQIFATPIYCVNDYTAHIAERLGFKVIHNAGGKAENLYELVLAQCVPNHGKIIYLRGEHVAFPLSQTLSENGFSVYDLEAYRTHESKKFSHGTLSNLKLNQIKSVAFFSARTADIFLNLVKNQKLNESLNHVYALCIGESVVKCFDRFEAPWKDVYVSETPDQNGMIALIQNL